MTALVVCTFVRRILIVLTAYQTIFLHYRLSNAAIAPNELLGTCFDDAWATTIAANLSISATDRDSSGTLKNPHLHGALATPRFRIDDQRTTRTLDELYQTDCLPTGSRFYGVGARVDENGAILNPGRANGSLVLEMNSWTSHTISTFILSILAQELLGYEVSYFTGSGSNGMAQRMSSVGTGACSPTHANLEIWPDAATTSALAVYANESSFVGSVGYDGLAGLYTSTSFVADGLRSSPTFSADFWRDYRDKDALIHSLRASRLFNNRTHYPPEASGCADGQLGCLNACSKSEACTTREANGGECLVVIMMIASYDAGYLQAAMSNNGIPAYFCFLGISGAVEYIVESLKNNVPVAFYHYQPDEFHQRYAGQIERVALPWSTPSRTALNTGTYGENGYGKATDNPVGADFPHVLLKKYAANLVSKSDGGIASLVTQFTLQETDIDSLLTIYDELYTAGVLSQTESYFHAACSWLRRPESYSTWSTWLEPLPVCEYDVHYSFTLEGCDSTANSTESFPRRVKFYWLVPQPGNASIPYNCDAYTLPNSRLPDTLVTSRSCLWLTDNTNTWLLWITLGRRPQCDSSFYTYDVSECMSSGQRKVEFRWFIPNTTNPLLSSECNAGSTLPEAVLIDCEYVPYSTTESKTVFALASVLACLMLAGIAFVVYHREKPIIKRSQYQFLVTMLLGGILMCYAAVMYSGPPSHVVCALRPTLVSMAFTLIFGSLVVKSMRVYRVFLSSSLKRVVLSTATMMKVLAGFLVVDIVILLMWELVSPSTATTKAEKVAEIGGLEVDRLHCASSSSVFVGLLFFWKAVMLFGGLYLSILIRKVSSDFQESVWIFASAVVVLFSSLLLLPMGYLVTLAASVFFLFFAFILLSATSLVIGLMLVPKIHRLHEMASEAKTTRPATSSTRSGTKGHSSGSEDGSTQVAPLRFRPRSRSRCRGGGSKSGRSSRNEGGAAKHEDDAVKKDKTGTKKQGGIRVSVPVSMKKFSAKVGVHSAITPVVKFSTAGKGPKSSESEANTRPASKPTEIK